MSKMTVFRIEQPKFMCDMKDKLTFVTYRLRRMV